ncbi:MAG TPA: ATP-dependent Clp protease ATP-binding subunit ClpX, partial [Coxiellaceae bacterium]|nr:ATP-dependent Clp protease ATP-binding subunit ClpX [Coxiellaceae bacterium]
IPEFVGRLPIIAVLDELEESDLVRILKEPKNSLTKQYHKLFHMENADIEFQDEALNIIAQKALAKKAGARGLRSILENLLLETMYQLPSQKNISKIIIDTEVVNGKKAPILVYNEELKKA